MLTGVSGVRDVEDLDAVVISTCNVGIVAGDGYRVCTVKFTIDTDVGVVYGADVSGVEDFAGECCLSKCVDSCVVSALWT